MFNVSEQIGVPFSSEEYNRRLGKVRSIMEEKGIELLMLRDPANVNYLTGYNTIGFSNYGILFVTNEGDLTMLVRYLEKQVAFVTSLIKDIKTWDDHENPYEVTKKIITEKGWINKKIGFEKSNIHISVRDYEILNAALDIDLLDGSGIIEEVRTIKSPAEVEFLRKSAKLTEIGMKAGMENLAEGKTENQVIAKVYEAMISAGSEYPSGNPIMTSGWKSGVPHTTYFRYKLQKGDAVLFELGSVYNRYTSALMRSAVIGDFNPEIKLMHDICVEALEAAINKIKPGVTSGEVDEACRSIIEKAGYYENFRKRTGYSVGLSYPPTWGEGHMIDLKKDDSRPLQPGMVFHMPPALRKYNEYGVGVSETILVTENGCDVLTNFSRELHIVK